MPIVDYAHIGAVAKKALLSNPKISSRNKEALKRFLEAYKVSPARENIFCRQIGKMIERVHDIEKEMHDPDVINPLFKKLRNELSDSYYSTVVNVSLCFVRWLNDGEKPKGFKDIKNTPKSAQRRSLKPKDMLTWEEGLLVAQQSQSIQMQAVLLTQLDCGFRPSEFIDLNYGDVSIKGEFVIFSVKGKTDARDVWMHRAVPYFLRWYDNHPTKKKDDPLWVLENMRKSAAENKANIIRYNYRTLQLRIDFMMEKSGLKKPSDFYILRHSSCVLDKKDNVPEELAANRHGHSIAYYSNTYGRLDIDGVLQRARKHYGMEDEEKKEPLKNIKCPRCKAINEPKASYCQSCGSPLTTEQAAKSYAFQEEMSEELKKMKSRMDRQTEAMIRAQITLKKKGKNGFKDLMKEWEKEMED